LSCSHPRRKPQPLLTLRFPITGQSLKTFFTDLLLLLFFVLKEFLKHGTERLLYFKIARASDHTSLDVFALTPSFFFLNMSYRDIKHCGLDSVSLGPLGFSQNVVRRSNTLFCSSFSREINYFNIKPTFLSLGLAQRLQSSSPIH